MAIPKQLLAVELQKAAPPPPQPHIASCWAQLGALWSCTSPASFLARVSWVSARRAGHRARCLGMRPWRVGFVFCENQTHNQARQPSKACREGWQASLPVPHRAPPPGATDGTSCHPGWHRRPSGQGLGPALASQPDPLLPGINWNRNERESLSSV